MGRGQHRRGTQVKVLLTADAHLHRHFLLPVLTKSSFIGFCECMEDYVAQIDTIRWSARIGSLQTNRLAAFVSGFPQYLYIRDRFILFFFQIHFGALGVHYVAPFLYVIDMFSVGHLRSKVALEMIAPLDVHNHRCSPI